MLLTSVQLPAQRVKDKVIPNKGSIKLYEGITIPKVNSGYTLWMPEQDPIRGLIVFIHPRRDTVNSEFLIDHALEHDIAVLYATTENCLEFFFDETRLQEIENYIYEVLDRYQIPSNNMMYCGISLGGTRAIALAVFGQSRRSLHHLIPRAVVVCDSPLDMVRFDQEMTKAMHLAFNEVATNEGAWVSGYLEQNLGGTPSEAFSAYVNYSPYCYAADLNPALDNLVDIAIRAYTEPDVNW